MTPLIQEQLSATGIAQVIVVLNVPPATPATAGRSGRAKSVKPAAATPTLESLALALTGYFIPGQRRGAAFATASVAVESTPPPRLFQNLGLILGTTDRNGVAALVADPRVRSCTAAPQISLIRPVVSVPSPLAGTVTWGLERLGIPAVWKAGFTGKGVLVGHLDTGVDGGHPALKGAIGKFAQFDFLGNSVAGAKPHDSDDHGTHTAGTIVGRKVRAAAFGVAPEAKLASALVIEGGNVSARILGGMDWIVGLGAKVLSMSLGLGGYHEDFLPVTQVLRERGVLPVFAIGNEGPGTSRSPGNYPETLSVGACDEKDQVADFSSSQRFLRPREPLVPDLVAPGTNVLSAVPGGGYAQMSGTSMATPHVAGLAALLWQAKMTATVDEIETALFASCQRPPGMLEERGNRGIPHGPGALAALLGDAALEGPHRGETGSTRRGGRPMTAAKIDPELLRQLEAAGDAPVGVVFNLRRGPAQKGLSAEETERCVKHLLQQAQEESGMAPQQIRVFRNLGSFAVSAAAPFVRKLLGRNEVLSATANQQPEELLIRPVESKSVKRPRPAGRKHK